MQQLTSKRDFDYCVIHTHAGNQNDKEQNLLTFFKSIGWQKAGYHIFIEKEQRLGQSINSGVRRLVSDDVASNGVGKLWVSPNKDIALSNANTINICYAGGLLMQNGKVARDKNKKLSNNFLGDFIPVDNRTAYQMEMMKQVVLWYHKTYPHLIFLGHNQITPQRKNCPCFYAPNWLEFIGIPKKNIYYPDNFGVNKVCKYFDRQY
jgi:hypothetical protein